VADQNRVLRAAVIAVAVALLAFASSASAATITVTTTSDEVLSGDGLCSLREAIQAVNAPPGDGDCGNSFTAHETIRLGPRDYTLTMRYGGGALRLVSTKRTVKIAGAGQSVTTVDATGLHDRALVIGSGANVTLTGLTVSGGRAPNGMPGTTPAACGGPDVCVPGTDGKAGSAGGGILNSGSLTLVDAAVTHNRAGDGGRGGKGGDLPEYGVIAGPGGGGGAGGAGGGIFNTGTLKLVGATVADNQAGNGGAGGDGGTGGGSASGVPKGNGGAGGDGGSAGAGGGIANEGGTVRITASTITNNFAGDGGDGGDAGTSFGSGSASGGDGTAGSLGGGISSTRGALSLTNSTIAGNWAGAGGSGGAGGDNYDGVSAGGDGGYGANGGNGGGVSVTGGAARMLNVTLAGNWTGAGGRGGPGGASNTTGAPGFNGTPGVGGGVYSEVYVTTLQNSLVASNPYGNCSGPISDGGHNLTFDGTGCPASFLRGNPRLGLLQGNGGPTQTMALRRGSAAIDRIPAVGAGCPATDQRGVRRPQPAGGKCDIGAFEYVPHR